jgi:hypothetical protein
MLSHFCGKYFGFRTILTVMAHGLSAEFFRPQAVLLVETAKCQFHDHKASIRTGYVEHPVLAY